jgi:hypothetical protein
MVDRASPWIKHSIAKVKNSVASIGPPIFLSYIFLFRFCQQKNGVPTVSPREKRKYLVAFGALVPIVVTGAPKAHGLFGRI